MTDHIAPLAQAAGDHAMRKAVADGVTAIGAGVAVADWLDVIAVGYHGLMGIGAGLLLAGRLYLMWREVQEKRQARNEG
jgi:hypothetical protein